MTVVSAAEVCGRLPLVEHLSRGQAGSIGRVAAVRDVPYPWRTMPRPTNIILHSPVRDQTMLDTFVERCLSNWVAWIAVVGDGASDIEEIIDEIVVGQGSDANRFILTSSHPAEE